MDLEEKRQLDLAAKVATVRAHARPWRAILALVLAIAAAAVSRWADAPHNHSLTAFSGEKLVVAKGAAVAFGLLAAAATVRLAGKARTALQPAVGSSHAEVVRYAIVLAGGLAAIIFTMQLLDIPVTQLVVGGALTGVIIGIAAQQSLANLFAGIMLLMARPFAVGDRVRIRSGSMGGQIEGTVSEISITYVRLDTADGVLNLPNAQVLAAAIGPADPDAASSAPGGGSLPARPASEPARRGGGRRAS